MFREEKAIFTQDDVMHRNGITGLTWTKCRLFASFALQSNFGGP
jgi:hypothetical protein